MKNLLENLVEQLKETSGGTKLVALLVGAGMLAILGLAAVVSSKPHYEMAFSGLADHELPKVTKALAEAGITFEVSQPPGPFTVFVDESERPAAYRAAYGAGALDKPLKGIMADSGVASVFNSAEERQQAVRKREWGEVEKMLEVLDFVVSAQVRTSRSNASPLTAHKAPPVSASVTLLVAGDRTLTREQSETVANLVSRSLGVQKRDLIIADQTGNSLYDGAEKTEEDHDVRDLLARQTEFEQRTTAKANAVLDSILGPNRARVEIASEWNYVQSTTRTETPSKGSVISETKNSTERPLPDGGVAEAGVPVGVSGNVPAAGGTGAPVTAATSSAGPLVEKTLEEKKDYQPGRTTEERVSFVPTIERLSVALFLDSSVDEAQSSNLEEAIKATVGFDDARDNFSSVRITFNTESATEELAPGDTSTPEPAPRTNPLMERLLGRGVEIVTALVFVILLVKSLRASSKKPASTTERTQPEDVIDPELLARVQVEELLRSEPDKVGAILSSWARGDRPLTGARP